MPAGCAIGGSGPPGERVVSALGLRHDPGRAAESRLRPNTEAGAAVRGMRVLTADERHGHGGAAPAGDLAVRPSSEGDAAVGGMWR
jgi:hypothetical protein